MKDYSGVKVVAAEPMSRGEYNAYRGWKIPSDENPADEGYHIRYSDGYESWCPKKQFNEGYRRCDNMTFGIAIEALKKGKKVARAGWNGKRMFLYYVPVGAYAPCTEIAASLVNENGLVEYGAYIAMKTAQGNVVPWLASQTDMLAEDWIIIE